MSSTVQIGQPAEFPEGMVNALKTLFAQRADVAAAYLGWIYNAATGEPPHYIFAIESSGNLQEIFEAADGVIKPFQKPDEIIDFMPIGNNGGLSEYFLEETEAFFRK